MIATLIWVTVQKSLRTTALVLRTFDWDGGNDIV